MIIESWIIEELENEQRRREEAEEESPGLQMPRHPDEPPRPPQPPRWAETESRVAVVDFSPKPENVIDL